MDAIYHTSIVLDGTEYYFGQGIQTAVPGSTHHGQPMEVVHLGMTELPRDVVEEYIQSMEEIYSPEVPSSSSLTYYIRLEANEQSYDLFLHNCNNFTQDLAMFLVGKHIPEHIRNLPQTFLNTPFGQMMKPQIESALRGVTQGTGTAGVPHPAPARPAPGSARHGTADGTVKNVSNTQQLDQQLAQASQSKKAVVIFFTSATCPPCKMVYPTYDELAGEAGPQATLIKVDISSALDVGMRYQVRATPTFMSFLDNGEKIDEWSGANPGQLRGNVQLLLQLQRTRTQHPHYQLDLPTLQREIPYVLYKKVPPLDKVRHKLDNPDNPTLTSIITFLQARNTNTSASASANVPIPDIPQIATYLQTTPQTLARPNHFAVVDLARLLFLDPRISAYFAERDPTHTTLLSLFSLASSPHNPPSHPQTNSAPAPAAADDNDKDKDPPYNLRIVLLHLACNLFSSPLYRNPSNARASESLHSPMLHLATSSLLDSDHAPLRVAAASYLFNLSALVHNTRLMDPSAPVSVSVSVSEEEQVEMAAAMIEALRAAAEAGPETDGLVTGLGLLVYGAEMEGAVVDVCRAMGVWEVLGGVMELGAGDGKGVEEVRRLFDQTTG